MWPHHTLFTSTSVTASSGGGQLQEASTPKGQTRQVVERRPATQRPASTNRDGANGRENKGTGCGPDHGPCDSDLWTHAEGTGATAPRHPGPSRWGSHWLSQVVPGTGRPGAREDLGELEAQRAGRWPGGETGGALGLTWLLPRPSRHTGLPTGCLTHCAESRPCGHRPSLAPDPQVWL